MPRYAAALLDIDGTLIYSNDEHARAFELAAEEMGIESPGFDAVRRLIGKGGDKLIPEAFGFEADSDRGKELDERKGEIFRARFGPELRPTPGTRMLVERLRGQGMRIVIATSANGEDLALLLKRAGVEDLVDECTTSDDVEESKPDPDIVQAAVRLAGVGTGEAVMIGDTPYDVEAARRAGVAIIAVRTGGWTDEELRGALKVYDSPVAILDDLDAGPLA